MFLIQLLYLVTCRIVFMHPILRYFVTFSYKPFLVLTCLTRSRFGFKGWIWILIAPKGKKFKPASVKVITV